MNTVNPTRVALIGCGAIATTQHLPAYEAAASAGLCRLVGVCDLDAERAHSAASHFGVPAFEDYPPKPTDPKKLEQIDPMVRNSVVAHLSAMTFESLRAMPIPELQGKLESALFDDFASKKLAMPFANVLVSKLIVQ